MPPPPAPPNRAKMYKYLRFFSPKSCNVNAKNTHNFPRKVCLQHKWRQNANTLIDKSGVPCHFWYFQYPATNGKWRAQRKRKYTNCVFTFDKFGQAIAISGIK